MLQVKCKDTMESLKLQLLFADFSYTVVGKQKAGQSVRSPSNTKLVDIQAPDLSQGSQKSLSLANNQLSRSITLSASQSFAGPRPSYGPINPIPDTGDNKVRAVNLISRRLSQYSEKAPARSVKDASV